MEHDTSGNNMQHKPEQPFIPSKRKSLIEIYASTAEAWSGRSTCLRTRVGGLLVREGRTIATGFNGSASKNDHCLDVGCLIQVRDGRESCIRTLHCEKALISFCAKYGIVTDGCDLWITLCPCYDCSNMLINAGIKGVFYRDQYGGKDGLELLLSRGIKVEKWETLLKST